MRSAATLLIVCVSCVGSVGCGPRGRVEPPRVPVKGIVILDGKPMQQGTIYFKSLELGLIDGISVADGRFSGHAIPGVRRIEFSRLVSKRIPLGGGLPDEESMVEALPSHLNSDSTFNADVTDAGPNDFRFEISAKPFRR